MLECLGQPLAISTGLSISAAQLSVSNPKSAALQGAWGVRCLRQCQALCRSSLPFSPAPPYCCCCCCVTAAGYGQHMAQLLAQDSRMNVGLFTHSPAVVHFSHSAALSTQASTTAARPAADRWHAPHANVQCASIHSGFRPHSPCQPSQEHACACCGQNAF
jgi:hypothetical protein